MSRPPVAALTPDGASIAGMRLTREHFRYLSGWAQGLDAQVLWERYLYACGTADLRRIRAVTSGLHDELGARARRAGRPGIAALLRQRSKPATTSAPSLTLDEFSATLPADMHSEAELIALWKESQADAPSPQPAQHRLRLIERQLEALRWLESLAVAAPRPTDSVSAWFDDKLARRLSVVGIETLDGLQRWIGLHGHHWHRHVPRVGVQGATRVMHWLASHADTLGALPAHAQRPRSQIDPRTLAPPAAVGVVPLERLHLPPTLSGVHGSNRAEPGRRSLDATDDLSAVRAWLSRHPAASHTWRTYRREAERFLLWAVFERGQALSSLDAADCGAFREFLAAPGAHWVSPRHVPRWSDRWRPLEAGLSPASINTAIAIVKSLCGWLVRQGHLNIDPWERVAGIDRVAAPPSPPRALADGDWALLQRWLAHQPATPSAVRLQALVGFAAHTGLRESELAAARTGWLRRTRLADGRLMWSVDIANGIGHAAPRTIDLPETVARQLLAFLVTTGVPATGPVDEIDRPLFAHRSDPLRALTPGRIYTLVKCAFLRCAMTVESSDPATAARLRRASTQWLRHTHAMHLAADGLPRGALQRRLGHRSPASSAAYLRGFASDRHNAPPP